MSNVAIDRQKFKELLAQFKGDIGYQTELFNTLIEQMPDNYVDELINTLYYERIYDGDCYFIQHYLYKTDKKVFLSFASCLDYLNSIAIGDKVISRTELLNVINKKYPLNGYYVIKHIKGEKRNVTR